MIPPSSLDSGSLFLPQRQLFFAEKLHIAELTSPARGEAPADALARKQQEYAAAHAHVEARLATLGAGRTNRDIINLCYRAAAHRLAGGGPLPSLTTDQRVADLAYRIGRDLGTPLDALIKQGRDQPFHAPHLSVALPSRARTVSAPPPAPAIRTAPPAAPSPTAAVKQLVPPPGATVTSVLTIPRPYVAPVAALPLPTPESTSPRPLAPPGPRRAPDRAPLSPVGPPYVPPDIAYTPKDLGPKHLSEAMREKVTAALEAAGIDGKLDYFALQFGDTYESLKPDTKAVHAQRNGDTLTITVERTSGRDVYTLHIAGRAMDFKGTDKKGAPRDLRGIDIGHSLKEIRTAADTGKLKRETIDQRKRPELGIFRGIPSLASELSRPVTTYETTWIKSIGMTAGRHIFINPEHVATSMPAGITTPGWATDIATCRYVTEANELGNRTFHVLMEQAAAKAGAQVDNEAFRKELFQGLAVGIPGVTAPDVSQANEFLSDVCSISVPGKPMDIFRIANWSPAEAKARRPSYFFTASCMRVFFRDMLLAKAPGRTKEVKDFLAKMDTGNAGAEEAVDLFGLKPADMAPIITAYQDMGQRILAHLARKSGLAYVPSLPLTS